jgi:Holliday junction resolvasome RuvABC DNA-binding subunit
VSSSLGRVLGPLLDDRQSHRAVIRPPQASARVTASLQQRARPATVTASREGIAQLVAMGFSEADARAALERSNNDVQAATSLLL